MMKREENNREGITHGGANLIYKPASSPNSRQMTGWDLLSEFAALFVGRGLTYEMTSQLIHEHAPAPRSVLVVGAGTGAAIRPLSELGCHLLALDRSVRMAERCYASGVSCVVGEAVSLPVREHNFDLVIVVTGVLDSMDDWTAEIALRECYRVAQHDCMLVTAHFDHSSEEAFYSRWNLVAGDRVLTLRKITLWHEYERRPHDFQGFDRVAIMAGFFDALRATAYKKDIPLEEALAALPQFQVIRSPPQLSNLLARAGWRTYGMSENRASGAFYLLAH